VETHVTEPKMEVDERADRSEVDLRVGQVLEIRLPENPTTGYRWQVVRLGEPACTLRDDSFELPGGGASPEEPARPGRPGRPGTHHWRIEAVQPGTGEIELASRRAWGDQPAAKEFRLTARVSG
jgi:inhibitor of cysteine peptidase